LDTLYDMTSKVNSDIIEGKIEENRGGGRPRTNYIEHLKKRVGVRSYRSKSSYTDKSLALK
jgi:hypothetical protein